MRIRWLRQALINLNDEATFISKEDPVAARLVVQRIQTSIDLLSDNPALGYAGRIHGTRELRVPRTRYVIPYRVRPRLNQIEILRVFHTSRKLPQHW